MPEAKPSAAGGGGRSRLIVRLGAFLASHHLLVSVVCCLAGFVALLLLPVLAKTTYVSENALIPGSASTLLSMHDVDIANKLINEIEITVDRREVIGIIRQFLEYMGAEVYHHRFFPDAQQFHPMNFFTIKTNSLATGNDTVYGLNTVGIIRAPRGDGKEAIVLVSPYDSGKLELDDKVSLGLGISVFSLLTRMTWLAKDIVWVAADSKFLEYTSVSSWLNCYHGTCFQNDPSEHSFKRAGTIAAALVLKIDGSKGKNYGDSVIMYAEASNGQMPNLDLLNIVHYLAVHRQGFQVNVDTFGSLVNLSWIKFLGEVVQKVGSFAKSLNLQMKIDTNAAAYVDGMAALTRSIYNQALGVPTGSHGAFRDYQVDAVTLEFSSRSYIKGENGRSAFLLKSGRLVEGVVRSLNNLLEKFHQSFFLYFLTAPNKFLSNGVYMIPFALLVAPLPIAAAALYGAAGVKAPSSGNSDTDKSKASAESWNWLQAARVLFLVHLWAIIVSLLPYFILQISDNAQIQCIYWLGLSVGTLLALFSIFGSPYSAGMKWELLKASMVATTSIGLGLMSIINFATAQLGAIMLVPLCLLIRPLKAQLQLKPVLCILLQSCNITLCLLGSPPAMLIIAKGLSDGFRNTNIAVFWEWMEFLWRWNSASYLYILLVHLPCWLLAVCVLLHPAAASTVEFN